MKTLPPLLTRPATCAKVGLPLEWPPEKIVCQVALWLEGREMSRREELEKEGWIRTFERSGDRQEECVALYQELGYEVHLEPMSEEDFPLECKGCAVLASCGEYQVIFIRPKKATR